MSSDLTALWRKTRRFIIHRVLHADDTPHRIALGVAIGIFVGLTPTVGFQMIIAGAIAVALRANKLVCIPMVWITNPVTLWPIYAACFSLGNALIGTGQPANEAVAVGQLRNLDSGTRVDAVSRLLELSFWRELSIGITRVGAELWVGCLVVAIAAAAIVYLLSRWGVVVYRERRQLRIEERHRRRVRRRYPKRVPARGPSL